MITSSLDILEEKTEENQTEEPVPVPTRPDFIQAMPPPEEKSAFSKIMDTTFRGMGATSFQLPPVQEGEPAVIDVFEERGIETAKRREELTGDVGYQGTAPEAATYVTGLGQLKIGFGQNLEQIEEGYRSNLRKKPDGSPREVNFIYDEGANPFSLKLPYL